MRKAVLFATLLGLTYLLLLVAPLSGMHFDGAQKLSVLVFSTFIYGTLLFGEFRLAFALGGIAVLLLLKLLTIEQFVLSANLKVIVFLINMFMVIGYLEENRFFEHVVNRIVTAVGPRPTLLIVVIMMLATVSAALVDEVTSILFMSGAMLHLTSRYKLNPVPFVIMLVFATNIGSAASSIGNPIGVMIALDAGFTFAEFLRWSAPVAVVVNLVTYGICRWWFAADFLALASAIRKESALYATARADYPLAPQLALAGAPAPGHLTTASVSHAIGHEMRGEAQTPGDDVAALRLPWLVFCGTILLLITHGMTEKLLGLAEGTMMVGASLIMGAVVLFLRRSKARELVERRVDWWTLSFFMMLFASVGTLEHTHVTKVIADRMISATDGNSAMLIQVVGWSTGCLSAFLDNVLAVATFLPVVHDVRVAAAPSGFPAAIYWCMLFGGTFMGNMTVIGSTANIVALGVLEKRGHGTVAFWQWMKIGLIVSIVSMVVAILLMEVQMRLLGNPLLPAPGIGQ